MNYNYTRTSYPQHTGHLRTADIGVTLLSAAESVAFATIDRGPGATPLVILAIAIPVTVMITLGTGSRLANAAALGQRPRRDDLGLFALVAGFGLLAAMHADHWALAGVLVAGVVGVAVLVRGLRRAADADRAEAAQAWARVRRTRMGQAA